MLGGYGTENNGLEIYQSFYEVLKDLPTEVIILSLIIAVAPILLYYIITKIQLKPLSLLSRFVYSAVSYKRKNQLESMAAEEYNYIYDKTVSGKITAKNIVSFCIGIGMVVFIFIVLKKMIFFGLVVSQSMAPLLMPTDMVLMESITKNVNEGDIVLFKPPGSGYSIIHRVVKIENGKIRTKGDNSNTLDYWILSREDIEAKAVELTGKPIVLRNFGVYFMAPRTVTIGPNPLFELTKKTVQFTHLYGPVILIFILLLILLRYFSEKREAVKYSLE